MRDGDPRGRLIERIEQLTEPQIHVVADVVAAMLRPVSVKLNPGSWLADDAWAESFLARLRAHHALSTEPLARQQFEAAFNRACEETGWIVVPEQSATHRFTDTSITKGSVVRRLSLKASAAKDLRPNFIHISKLTEAAGIQDVRRQVDRRDLLRDLFTSYRRACDSIIILRAFANPQQVRYELAEVSTDLFAPVQSITTEQAQPSTISIPPTTTDPDFKIRVDRSDSKITLTAIKIERCTVHGEWTFINNE